jgi:hypothetical protein
MDEGNAQEAIVGNAAILPYPAFIPLPVIPLPLERWGGTDHMESRHLAAYIRIRVHWRNSRKSFFTPLRNAETRRVKREAILQSGAWSAIRGNP